MKTEEYERLTDEELEKIIEQETNDLERMQIIRAFSTDELMLKYAFDLPESERSGVTYSLKNIENKVKIIDSLTDERYITAATVEIPSNKHKIRQLKRVKKPDYKLNIIKSINGNPQEIIGEIEQLEDEKDKALIVATLEDKEIKFNYLDRIKDINNKSIIVMSLDNDEQKLDYMKAVEDEGTRSLLIASLIDRNLRNNLLDSSDNKYQNISTPDGMTVGMEIECEGEKSIDSYMLEKFFSGWNAKVDTSLQEGVEITTPVLTNKKEEAEDLYCICNTLQKIGQATSERCGGHIHIGADYLKTKQAYVNLIELWANNEDIMYLLSNSRGEMCGEGAVEYATPISRRILEAIKEDKFADFDSLSKDEFIERIKKVQQEKKDKELRRTGINFLRVNDEINTIEFRLPNGTIDANTWIENANLFGNIIAISQRLSDIQSKNVSERTDEENATLEKYAILKTKDTNQQDRLRILLDLCIPDELRQVYNDRYKNNRIDLSKNSKIETELNNHISDETIVFLTDEKVSKIAREQDVAMKKAEAQGRWNNLDRQNTQEYLIT